MTDTSPDPALGQSGVGLRKATPRMALFLVLGIAVLLFALAFFVRTCARAPGEMTSGVANAIREAFRPNVEAKTVLLSTLTKTSREPKLVVLTQHLDVEARVDKTKSLWGIELGNYTTRILAHDNRVQYIVRLQALTAEHFEFDSKHSILTIRCPVPEFDEETVDVQSDPNKIEIDQNGTWTKIVLFSGTKEQREAQVQLRPTVVLQAKHDLVQSKARDAARETLTQYFGFLAEKLRPEVRLQVEFTDTGPRDSTPRKDTPAP